MRHEFQTPEPKVEGEMRAGEDKKWEFVSVGAFL
jgi:hypothetical protein